jgi:uncharacterized RDD family membrane protein YckC
VSEPRGVEQYVQRGVDDRARRIVTPEGVPLAFRLASGGDRAGAFVLDVLFLILGLVIVGLLLDLAGGGAHLTAVAIVFAFVIRNFYFVIFETRWQGATPGKRIVGIRVIDAHGGQLEAGAILARNLVRELEVWQPLALIFASDQLWPTAPGWARLLACLWVFAFAFMPLFNKDRVRVGDLLAGTRVVVAPKPVLLPDLAEKEVSQMWGRPSKVVQPTFAFTAEQLGIYGIYELQVLEGVLRADDNPAAHLEAVATVASKIAAKIKYTPEVPSHLHERFLRDFYTALRAHLEKRMLFGQRRADKYSR